VKQIVITLPLVCDKKIFDYILSEEKNYDFMYASSDNVQELENLYVQAPLVRSTCKGYLQIIRNEHLL